jgi:hypothetical protein
MFCLFLVGLAAVGLYQLSVLAYVKPFPISGQSPASSWRAGQLSLGRHSHPDAEPA